jgi:hypothetical protein
MLWKIALRTHWRRTAEKKALQRLLDVDGFKKMLQDLCW